MKAKNQVEKYTYYLKKKKEIILHGLGKSQLEGRKKGPKVVLNSLPKSGTHLLESLFFQLPYMRHCGKKTLKIQTQDPIEPKIKVLNKLKNGHFLLAHMQYHDMVLDRLLYNDLKLIQLVRDPRDVLLSHLNYIENMDKTQKSHEYIKRFTTREDKIKAMIEGKPHVLEPYPEVLDKFGDWLSKDQVLCIKFEDLIGPKGGGSQNRQLEAVESICDFISINVNKDKLSTISEKVYSPKSSTFNKGKIGNWKHTLNRNEKDWLNKAIQKQLLDYGYSV